MDAAVVAAADMQDHMYKRFVFKMEGVRPHAPLASDGNRCTGGGRDTLTFGQAVVHYVASLMAAARSGGRGLLVWHSTGSGKSCTAVAIAHAFWNTRRPIFYVTTAALRDKTEAELFSCASDLFAAPTAAAVAEQQRGQGQGGEEQGARARRKGGRGVFTTEQGFRSGLQVITYAILAHWIKKQLVPVNSVLVLDEVHNLYYPLPTQQEEHKQLISCLLHDQPSLSDAKVFIMTATPGSTPAQLFKLLNIIRDRRLPPIEPPDATSLASIDAFTRSLVGMVTYVDTNMDASRFPAITQLDPHLTELGAEQMQYYLQKLGETDDVEASYDALMRDKRVSRYWLKARKASNSLFNMTPDKQVDEFSAKLPLLLRNIAEHPAEKHYVYSAFYERYGFGGHGVVMIAKFLEAMGYEELTADKAARPELLAPGRKRFLLLTSSSLNSAKLRTQRSASDNKAVAASAEEESPTHSRAEKHRANALLAVFNSPRNARGELVGVILASQGYNEGIDLKAVRHVHLFEPLVEYNMEMQAIGRAARHCSHAQLRKDHGEWTVQVHRYIGEAPRELVMRLVAYGDDMTPDAVDAADAANADQELMVEKIVYREARERVREMRLYELCMKRAAVDCMLTRSFHDLEGQCINDE